MSQHSSSAGLSLPPNRFLEACKRYEERFGEAPILFILPDDELEAVAVIEAAIAAGKPMNDDTKEGEIF